MHFSEFGGAAKNILIIASPSSKIRNQEQENRFLLTNTYIYIYIYIHTHTHYRITLNSEIPLKQTQYRVVCLRICTPPLLTNITERKQAGF